MRLTPYQASDGHGDDFPDPLGLGTTEHPEEPGIHADKRIVPRARPGEFDDRLDQGRVRADLKECNIRDQGLD